MERCLRIEAFYGVCGHIMLSVHCHNPNRRFASYSRFEGDTCDESCDIELRLSVIDIVACPWCRACPEVPDVPMRRSDPGRDVLPRDLIAERRRYYHLRVDGMAEERRGTRNRSDERSRERRGNRNRGDERAEERRSSRDRNNGRARDRRSNGGRNADDAGERRRIRAYEQHRSQLALEMQAAAEQQRQHIWGVPIKDRTFYIAGGKSPYLLKQVSAESLPEDETCGICLSAFRAEPTDIVRLPCQGKHTFHKACIIPWLEEGMDKMDRDEESRPHCPSCRDPFMILNLDLEEVPEGLDFILLSGAEKEDFLRWRAGRRDRGAR